MIAIGFFHVNTAHAQSCLPSGGAHPTESEFVQDQWTAYAYNGNNTNFSQNDYKGYYIDNNTYGPGSLSFDTRKNWDRNTSPSYTANFNGCTVNNNSHSLKLTRTGFPSGTYNIKVSHNNRGVLLINGSEVYNDPQSRTSSTTLPNIYALDETSTIEFGLIENTGNSQAKLELIPTTDLNLFGDQNWETAVYSDLNFTNYKGSLTQDGVSFNSTDAWAGSSNTTPSSASTYVGSTVSTTNSYIYRRKGIPCGVYTVDIARHDDDAELIINGISVWSRTGYILSPIPDVWTGYLGPNSEIEMKVSNNGLYATSAGLTFNKIGPTDASYWTGQVSSDTADPANWCPVSPNATTSVFIPDNTMTPFDPVLTSNVSIKSLQIEDGGLIDLTNHTLEISDGFINEGTLVDDKINDLKLTGNAAYISGNGFEINTLTSEGLNVSLDLDAGEEMRILDVLEIPLGSFETNNQLVLGCQLTDLSQRVGQIGDLSSGAITGEVATEQCIPGRRAYRFVSAPVSTSTSIHANWQENATAWNNDPQPGYGTHITGSLTDQTNGFDMTTSGNPSLFVFDNSSQAWNAIDNTDVNTLDAGTPYRLLVRGDRSTDITSNTAAATPTILRTKGNVTSGPVNLAAGFNSTNGSFNFFGNPYPAAIDMSEVMQTSLALQEDYYVWDPTLGGAADANTDPNNLGGRGGFVTVDLEAGTEMGTNSAGSAANQYLQPGQATFVKVNTVGIPPQMLLNESNKNVTADQTTTFSSGGISSIDLTLYKASDLAADETARDGARLKFSEAYTTPVSTEDASKFGNLDENIAIANADSYLAIDRRAFPENDEIIPLFLNQYRANNYSLRIQMNEMQGYEFFITDAYLEEETQISDGFVFDFEVDANVSGSIDENRFALAMKPVTLGQEDITSEDWRMYPNPLEANTLTIDVPNALQGKFNVKVYDVLGHHVLDHKQDAENNRIELSNLNLSAGVYIVKITSDQEQASFVKKLIVK